MPEFTLPDFTDANTAGLYGLPVEAWPMLTDQSVRHGFRMTTIDCRDCAQKADLLDRIAVSLAFPDWFGHNWDALADCLDDLAWLPSAPGQVIVITHLQALEARSPEDLRTAKEIFAETAERSKTSQSPLWVFVELTTAAHQAAPIAPHPD